MLTHYPRIFLNSGPLDLLSSMRFESKHRVFKTMANSINSRRNLTHSLAKKYQFNFVFFLLSKVFFKPNVNFGVLRSIGDDNFCDIKLLKDFKKTSWVQINGITYKKDLVIIVSYDDFLQFGKTVAIYISNNNKVVFVYQKFITIGLCEHNDLYIVKSSTVKNLINFVDLYHYVVCYSFVIKGLEYILLPYHV